MSESDRIWDLMQRAHEGNVWHGPALRRLLDEVTPAQAAAHPIPKAHSIWETVLHVATYEDVVRRRLEAEHIEELPAEQSWPKVEETTPAAWRRALEALDDGYRRLRRAVAEFPDAHLDDAVPGRDYPFYLLLYGALQHHLYHSGQIVVLMQAQGLEPQG
jgi:uncharacterized damage-inducible protein DinB